MLGDMSQPTAQLRTAAVMTTSVNDVTARPVNGVRVGTAIPAISGRRLAAAERRNALGRIADAGLDHVMFGDHVSF
jgi:hypothetical protein